MIPGGVSGTSEEVRAETVVTTDTHEGVNDQETVVRFPEIPPRLGICSPPLAPPVS